MFSKEVQIEAVPTYLQGIRSYKIRKKFGIKGTDIIWQFGSALESVRLKADKQDDNKIKKLYTC